MEASRELSLLQNKTLEQVRSEKKVALPLEATASEDAFKNYQNKLRSRVRAMDDLKLYHEIKNFDYEQARGAKVMLPSAVNDAQNYREFKGVLVVRFRKMRTGESGGGRIDIPR